MKRRKFIFKNRPAWAAKAVRGAVILVLTVAAALWFAHIQRRTARARAEAMLDVDRPLFRDVAELSSAFGGNKLILCSSTNALSASLRPRAAGSSANPALLFPNPRPDRLGSSLPQDRAGMQFDSGQAKISRLRNKF